jgi:hypothetical protein
MHSERSFKITHASTVNGCKTKIPHHTRYMSSSPKSAAQKALTTLCSRKSIHGKCTLIITVKETTIDSHKKSYTYKVSRTKLDEPVQLANGVTFHYKTSAHKAHPRKPSRSCRRQSPGRMRRSSNKHKRSERSHKRSTARKRSGRSRKNPGRKSRVR